MDTDPKCPEEDSPELLIGFTRRQLRLLAHYSDPTGPAYGNATKAAELAGFKGCPGSNQLAVQGHRTIARARQHPGLLNLLINTDCTLKRAFERVSACMDAKVHRIFLTKDDQVVHVEAGDNHPVQLQAAKLVIDLHGLGRVTRQEPPPGAGAVDMAEPADQEEVSDRAMDAAGENHPSNHASLQDVVEGNSMSQESRAREHADEQENKSSTMGVTLPRFAPTILLQKLTEAKNIAPHINPIDIVMLAFLETYREYEHALEQQRKGCPVDMSKIRRDFCMIAGTLMKSGSAYAAVESSSRITVPDDLTPEQQELQRKAKTMDSRSRMLTREVIAAQEDVIRAKVKLVEMEAAAASQETKNRAEEDEHVS